MMRLLPLLLLLCTGVALAEDSGSLVDKLSMYDSLFTTESYSWIDTFFERVAAWVVLWWLELKLYGIAFTYDVAQHIIQQLGIMNQLRGALSGLDSQVYAFLDYLNVFEALNIILSAYATRMILVII